MFQLYRFKTTSTARNIVASNVLVKSKYFNWFNSIVQNALLLIIAGILGFYHKPQEWQCIYFSVYLCLSERRTRTRKVFHVKRKKIFMILLCIHCIKWSWELKLIRSHIHKLRSTNCSHFISCKPCKLYYYYSLLSHPGHKSINSLN